MFVFIHRVVACFIIPCCFHHLGQFINEHFVVIGVDNLVDHSGSYRSNFNSPGAIPCTWSSSSFTPLVSCICNCPTILDNNSEFVPSHFASDSCQSTIILLMKLFQFCPRRSCIILCPCLFVVDLFSCIVGPASLIPIAHYYVLFDSFFQLYVHMLCSLLHRPA